MFSSWVFPTVLVYFMNTGSWPSLTPERGRRKMSGWPLRGSHVYVCVCIHTCMRRSELVFERASCPDSWALVQSLALPNAVCCLPPLLLAGWLFSLDTFPPAAKDLFAKVKEASLKRWVSSNPSDPFYFILYMFLGGDSRTCFFLSFSSYFFKLPISLLHLWIGSLTDYPSYLFASAYPCPHH